MIDPIALSSLLSNYFQEIHRVSDTVLRCTRLRNGQTYQVLYFDYSDKILSYDLESYLKQHVSVDYFRNTGPLQWSFYLIFLTDQAIAEADRRRIEGNPDYARKLIIGADELPDWLNRTYLAKPHHATNSRVGLADIWRSVLKESRLDCIFSDQVKVNEGVDRIIANDYYIEKDVRASGRTFADSDIRLGEIRHFDPAGFREYPKYTGAFQFRKVNLIDGANGFGKTSLLESIEFFITGSNARVGEPSGQFKLTASFTNDLKPRSYKKDPALFRERDRVWYNGMDRQRGSDLAAHFNQFNFYNTDAAFRLTINKNEREIEEAFRDIALGDEVNFLKRQFAAYEARFNAELKAREKLAGEYSNDIEAQRVLLSDLRRSVDGASDLIAALFDKIGRLHLKLNIGSADLVSLDRLKFSLSVAITEVDAALNAFSWLEEFSLQKLADEQAKLTALNENLESFASAQSTGQAQELDNQLKDNNEAAQLLNELSNYLLPEHAILQGLDAKIDELRRKAGQLAELEQVYPGLDLKMVAFPDLALIEGRNRQTERLREKEAAVSQTAKEITQGRQRLSALNAVIATIKSEGKRFVELIPDGTECPLCQTDLQSTEARNLALLKDLQDAVDTNNFSDLLTVNADLEKDRADADGQIKILGTLISILQVSPGAPSPEITSARNAMSFIGELFVSLKTDVTNFEQLVSERKTLGVRGLNESRFNELSLAFNDRFPSTAINSQSLKATKESISRAWQETTHAKELSAAQAEQRQQELLAQIKAYDPSLDLASADVIRQRARLTEHHLDELQELVDESFDRHSNLRKLALELPVMIQQLDEVRADMDNKQKESTLAVKANTIIDEKTALLKKVNAENDRLQNSADQLEQLLKTHSEDDFLQEFLDNNKAEIREIFLAIHTPREFRDINMAGGKVILEKMNGGQADLMHVSTGQRSALALSLFLTLNNKLRNGPPMIIFDDPVAFTDDLNILSFLDYLREIVFDQRTSKQLFFATANENLSFLFQKKFEVLGEEFNHISLER